MKDYFGKSTPLSMSFQTVKCPQCGKAHIEYQDPNLTVTCTECKNCFQPFTHLAATSISTIPKKAELPKQTKPSSTKQPSPSEKIFEQVVNIHKTVQRFEREDLAWTRAGEVVLQEIKAQMSVLGKLVFESLDVSIERLREDLKPTFTFAPLSNRPQSLGLILAYLYVKMTEFGQEACIMLLAESEHWIFSHDTIELYKPELSKFVNITH